MDYKVVMPRLSDAMDEGQLVEWKIKPGDTVKSGDVIAEVESDKAVIEIQTFKSGRVKALLVQEGETVPVGTDIALIDTASSKEETPVREKQKVPDNSEKETAQPVKQSAPELQAETTHIPASPPNNIIDQIVDKEVSSVQPSSFTGGSASPRAKALAAQYGLDIDSLQKEDQLPLPAHYADVKRYYIRRYFTAKALELIAKYHLSTEIFPAGKKHSEEEVKAYIQAHEIPLPEPLDIAKRSMITMVNEAAKKPVYHMSGHLDARLMNHYATKELTVTVWLLKLLAEAMMRHPSFRMTLDTDTRQLWPNANISLAMAEGELLYMPVFKELNKKSVQQIAQELQSFKTKLSARRLSKEDLTGSTFGLSNLGMTGVEQFDAMINKNDCAIAAVGSEKEGQIVVTLTVDHRIINGYQAALFMEALKKLAEDPKSFKEH